MADSPQRACWSELRGTSRRTAGRLGSLVVQSGLWLQGALTAAVPGGRPPPDEVWDREIGATG